jgi:competence protein ComEC
MAVVEGAVVDDPEYRAQALRAVIQVSRVNGKEEEGRVLAVLPRDTPLAYGDSVSVRGELQKPEPFATDTGRTFDYPGYLETRGISLLVPRAEMREMREGEWSLMRALFSVKHVFKRALERVMDEPNVSLMEGLLLGEKSGLPKELTAAFVMTGLIHIVVLSGYNIGVVAEWTIRLMELLLRRRGALVAAGVVIVLFALLAGGGMATIRACLMGVIALLARYLNRPLAAMRALVVAAAGMALYNPLVLFDVGFILSILATFGLIALSPFVESKLLFVPQGALRATAATTIAVQLFVLPALLYFTGVLSLVAVPLNVVVLPLVPLAMLSGFLSGLLSLVHPYLAFLPTLFSDMLLGGVIFVTQAAAALPLSAVVVPAFPLWVALFIYAPLCVFAISTYRRTAALSASN